jgi:hypothetical protein
MDNPEVKIRGGVTGARRILGVIADATGDDEVKDCLKDLFLFELANDMKGSNRYKPEYEKRIGIFAERSERESKRSEP